MELNYRFKVSGSQFLDPLFVEYNVIYIGPVSCLALLQIRSRVSAIMGLSLAISETVMGILTPRIK